MKNLVRMCLILSIFKINITPLCSQDQLFKAEKADKVPRVLSTVFDEVNVFTLPTKDIGRYLSSQRSDAEVVSIQINEQMAWDFKLEPVEILTKNTAIYTIGSEGKTKIRYTPKVKTYKGVFADGRDGYIRLTMNEGFMYASINDNGHEYFIEPLTYYDHQSAPSDQFVIYDAQSLKPAHKEKKCFRPDIIQEHVPERGTGSRTAGNCYEVNLAIMADYSMYSDPSHAGLDAVIDHLVAVMNNVQANYEYNGTTNFNDGILFKISELVVSICSTCDQLSSTTNPNNLLNEFSAWVDNNGFNHPFHAAHFWSNRDFVGSTVGLAYQSSNLFCANRARTVLEDWTSTAALLKTMVAHEVGHNFNGVHDGSTGLILSPTVSITDSWSTTSKSAINTQISMQAACLSSCDPPVCPRVEDVQITNINPGSFTISWTHTPQQSYIIKVKETGSTTFLNEFSTTQNTITITPTGYAICKKYDVLVYNNCSGGTLGAAARILMRAPTTQGCSDFAINKIVGWSGSTLNFIDKSLNASSWQWNFGNGQSSTQQNPSVTFNTPGNYDVSLTVNGVHTMSVPAAVTILPSLPAPFSLAQGGNFDNNNNYFSSEAIDGTTVNLWEKGSSSYVLATNGIAWKTKLNSDLPQVTTKSALYSPRFNFSLYSNYTLSFDIGMETTFCNAPFAAQLQYSLDNGTTWTRLGSAPTFYNAGPGEFCELATQVFSDKTGWTLNQNYVNKSIDLSFLSGNSSVIFRFVVSVSGLFSAGYNVDGVLIDNFNIQAANALVLPLDQSSLTADVIEKSVILKWNSTNPVDIQSYVVLRSKDGTQFEGIGNVMQENISSTNHHFTDTHVQQGRYFYRIMAIHHDGKETYTNMARVDIGNDADALIVYPNPIRKGEKLNVNFAQPQFEDKSIQVIDITQRQLDVPLLGSGDGRYIDTSTLENGLYILKVKNALGTTLTKRFIVAD
jgi:hypothetical protein